MKMSVERWRNDTDGKTAVLGEKRVPVPLYPLQISHRLAWDRTRASVVRGQQLRTYFVYRYLIINFIPHRKNHAFITKTYRLVCDNAVLKTALTVETHVIGHVASFSLVGTVLTSRGPVVMMTAGFSETAVQSCCLHDSLSQTRATDVWNKNSPRVAIQPNTNTGRGGEAQSFVKLKNVVHILGCQREGATGLIVC